MVESYEAARQAHLDVRAAQWPQVHDGNLVTAEDCVASLKRWAMRDPLGKMLMATQPRSTPPMPRP